MPGPQGVRKYNAGFAVHASMVLRTGAGAALLVQKDCYLAGRGVDLRVQRLDYTRAVLSYAWPIPFYKWDSYG